MRQQRLAADVLHGEERLWAGRGAGRAGLENLRDSRMLELAEHVRLVLEPALKLGRQESRADDLQRDFAAWLLLLHQVDHAHVPFAELPHNRIAADALGD